VIYDFKISNSKIAGQKYDNLVEWVNYSFAFQKTSPTRRMKNRQLAERIHAKFPDGFFYLFDI